MKPNYEVIALHEETNATTKVTTVTKVKVTRRGKETTQTVADVVIDINNDAANYACDNAKVLVAKRDDGTSYLTTQANATDTDKLGKLPRFS